jgi:hypothetical protein
MTAKQVVVFFHDVTCVAEAQSLFDRTPTAHGYDHRALLIAGMDDHVILGRELDLEYLGYLNAFGLGPAPARVHAYPARIDVEAGETHAGMVSRRVDQLRRLADTLRSDGATEVLIQPYVAHPDMEGFRSALEAFAQLAVQVAAGRIDVVAKYSSKHEGRILAERLGLQVPEGRLVEGSPADVAGVVIEMLNGMRPLVVKTLRGSGGAQVWVIDDARDLGGFGDWLARQDERVEVVVEAFVPARCAINVMMWIGTGPAEISLVGITDQRITERSIHSGNEYPSTTRLESEVVEWSRRLSAAMLQEGFGGYAGFDFIDAATDHRGGRALYFVEVNPRVNAALFPLEVTRLLNRRQLERGNPMVRNFLQRYRTVPPGRFSLYRDCLSRVAFREERGAGVVLYPPATLDAGALSYMVLGGRPEEVTAIEEELAAALGQSEQR